MKLCESCGACFDDNYTQCGFDGGGLTPLFPGSRVIGGRYLLEQRVASGAMGVVLRATHLQVGSTVAVKLMRPQKDDAHIALARFQREAQILGQIKHPNAVLVIDFGVDNRDHESVPFLAMEYLRGDSLHQLLEKKRRLSLEELDRILTPLCDAVEEAHAVGVIHRDIKPSNVVLEKLRDGSEIVKVLDFGIAKFVERGKKSAHAQALDAIAEVLADDDDLFLDEVVATRKERVIAPSKTVSAEGKPLDHTTDAGFMIGTIPYMAPEQMTGDRVSRRTDVHAVAVLAFQCLSGRLPYDGDDEDIIATKLSDERPSLKELGIDVDAHLDTVLQRAFALDPMERPASVREIAEAVRACRKPADGDALQQTLSGLDVGKRLLDEVEAAVRDWSDTRSEQDYARARDRLLALHAPLQRVHEAIGHVTAPLPSEKRKPLRLARSELDTKVSLVRRALPQAERADEEFGAYLSALWLRLDVTAQAILDAALDLVEDERTSPGTTPMPIQLFAQQDNGPAPSEIAERMLGKDPLDAVDAVESVIDGAIDVVAHLVGPARDPALAAKLVRGLWRHADIILLHELQSSRRGFRLLPFLAGLRDMPEAATFALLARALSTTEVRETLRAIDNVEDRRVLARCLLVHPNPEARTAAVEALELADLWNVIAHPSTPMSVARFLFEHLRTRARAEYLKVFFFCVRDNMRAVATANDLAEALKLLAQFFQVSCFHEDMVFEPLLELDRAVRQRAAAIELAVPDEAAYVEKLSAFTAKGQTETLAIDGMSDVPLPIQRKLAREGHFLSFFISHTNEKVAKETLPHLLRLDDITPFLRVTTIHRIVLTELAKRRRFFRKEAPRIALLQNPKTPAVIARMFVPLVSEEQLRVLSTSKHINPDVRRLISTTLRR
jgi:serine/threonine protein kinase